MHANLKHRGRLAARRKAAKAHLRAAGGFRKGDQVVLNYGEKATVMGASGPDSYMLVVRRGNYNMAGIYRASQFRLDPTVGHAQGRSSAR